MTTLTMTATVRLPDDPVEQADVIGRLQAHFDAFEDELQALTDNEAVVTYATEAVRSMTLQSAISRRRSFQPCAVRTYDAAHVA